MYESAAMKELMLNQRVQFFYELLNCENRIDIWAYGSDYRLIRSTNERIVLDTIFSHTGCLNYMKRHFDGSDDPIVLSTFLGLMWCGVKYLAEDGGAAMYFVMGPVFNSEVSLSAIREAAFRYNVDESWRDGFIGLLRITSTVPASMFFHYALMLEFSVNQRHIPMSSLAFQHSSEFDDGLTTHFKSEQPAKRDRTTTYYLEQKLMDNIRTGNFNYANDFVNARKISTGIRISTHEPIQQAIISCTTFISLCTRAAIEGGLSPDTAYSIGDGYIQAVMTCSNVTDLSTLIHKMYDQFIGAVQKKQAGTPYSRQIQSCIERIENHIFEDIRLSDLAAEVGYTDYYLSRRFKEETGISVKRYILQEKLKRGSELLCSTADSITSISEKLQFCSPSYFSSRFREQFGCLPQKYREEHQKL